MKAIEVLRRVSIFSEFTNADFKRILLTAKVRTFKANTSIIKKGDVWVVAFYLILSGKAEVRDGKKVIATRIPGDYFGEMALLANWLPTRTADVIAVEETECLVLSRFNFLALIKTHPEMGVRVMSELAHRVQELNESQL